MTHIPAKIYFNLLSPVTLRNRRMLRKFIRSLFRKERLSVLELNIIFCDDSYLLNLNRQFLNHDFYTDILSFPLSGPDEPLTAEIYISVDRVKENALAEETSFMQELHRVIFHGILHFCGYKDKSAGDQRLMRSKEDACLKSYFKYRPGKN